MTRKSLINVSKRIMAGCLTVAMILTGILVTPKEAKATTETTKTVHFASASDYKMSDYWNGTDNKAPVKAGYVFGGWFKAADENTAGAEQETSTGKYYAPLKNVNAAVDTAVAKFVPAEVLSIKTQKGTSTVNNETITSLRILSTVDSKNYQAVGFEYRLATLPEDTTKDDTTGKEITKVYSEIKKSKYDSETYTPGTSFVSGVSQYFIAADVSSISDASFTKIVYARPYWITMDGTKVMGLARNSRVEDKNSSYTSVGINLLPQLSEGKLAAVAAGKIQVTYNTTNYDVVETPDIATHDENGGKYLFPEMKCYVDDTTGTITFVGNADIQDGTLTNLAADGLFANVRFKKAENATDTALDFKIKTEATDFCNWAEADVTKFVVVQ